MVCAVNEVVFGAQLLFCCFPLLFVLCFWFDFVPLEVFSFLEFVDLDCELHDCCCLSLGFGLITLSRQLSESLQGSRILETKP